MNSLGFVVFASLLAATLAVDCSTLSDGVYEIGCKAFAKCTGSVREIIDCGMDMVYNNKTAGCDDPKNVAPPCGLMKDCTNKPTARYADTDLKCRSYYTCNDGKFLGHNPCPGSLVFNEKLQACDWEEHVAPPCGKMQPN